MIDEIERISVAGVSAPAGHYSHATAWNGLVFASGQLGGRGDGAHIADQPQVRQALGNVLTVLAEAGCGPERVLRVTADIVGVENWLAFNRVYARLSEARNLPAPSYLCPSFTTGISSRSKPSAYESGDDFLRFTRSEGSQDGSRRDLAQECLEFAVRQLDRMKVRRVFRKIPQARLRLLNRFPYGRSDLNSAVIHHDDVVAPKRRSQALLDIGEEHFSSHSPLNYHRGCHFIVAQGRHEGDRLP